MPIARQVVLYELNEVPWEIVDYHVAARPDSALAGLLSSASCLTTTSEERVIDLQPWRTWPTLHRSLWVRDHNSWDVGQDPSTFRGVDIWKVAARAGKRVGVFGALQSWPARRFPDNGFHVPDTFARTSSTVPRSLRRFQEFNLAMTAENRFAAAAEVRLSELPIVAADLLRHGLTARSALTLAEHLVDERRDPSRRAFRAVMQVVPAFDLFWRLQLRRRPDLSVFFTNHVATMLHRYWEDTVEDGPGATLVLEALDLFDRQLARMLAWQRFHPDAVVVIASSMGQGRVPKGDLGDVFVLDDAPRLAATLELDGALPQVGMYPAQSLVLPSEEAAAIARQRLESVAHNQGAMFRELRANGRTVSFEIDYLTDAATVIGGVTFEIDGNKRWTPIPQLGITVRSRPGGGNTGEHIPEGVLIAVGDSISADASRREVSVLDVAPSLLALIGVDPDESMTGRQGVFG